jgi:hypothetical protein
MIRRARVELEKRQNFMGILRTGLGAACYHGGVRRDTEKRGDSGCKNLRMACLD